MTGKNLYQASTPEEALDILQTVPIHLLILSIQFKTKNGFEFSLEIQDLIQTDPGFVSKDLKIVFITSNDNKEHRKKAKDCKAIAIFPKFFPPGELHLGLKKLAIRYFQDKIAIPQNPQKCILVIDDSDVNRRILVRLMEKNGYLTQQAENGKVAHEWLKENPFSVDLILSDNYMESMNGTELCVLLRNSAYFRIIPFFLITGEDDPDHLKELEKAGVDLIFSKPFNNQLLLEKIREYTSAT